MRYKDFNDLLTKQAERIPSHPALKYGEKCWTYRELLEAVDCKAEEYRESRKTCLGVLADGSADCVISLFAAAKAGLQLVMLDSALPDELYPSLLAYTDVDILCGDEELCEDLAPRLSRGLPSGTDSVLFFPSGTTSRAKAVELSQYSLCQSAYNGGTLLPLAEDDTLLCLLPLGHVFGFVCGLLWGLYSGACVTLGRGPRHYAEDCAYYKPTAVSVVPLLLGFLLKNHALNPELKLILIGAGDCPAQILDAAKSTGARISFGYGLTETSSGVALSLGDDPYAMTVCPDDTVTIADDGEILISAPTCVMKGYYKMPEATGAVLRYGMLRSGDLGRIDKNGLLHITGRKKDILVLSDGTKIFLPEYELQLMQALRRSELAVILQDGRPVLLCQTIPGDSKDPLKRRAAVLNLLTPLMRSMPRGQQITDVFFTDVPLPRTATGKIKRYELPQLIAELSNQ